jgi:hypothetical protein
MNHDFTSKTIATDQEIVDWLSDCLNEHAERDTIELTALSNGVASTAFDFPQRRRVGLMVSAAAIAVTALAGGIYLRDARDASPIGTSATPQLAALPPADEPSLLPPGIAIFATSEATQEAAAFAEKIDAMLASSGWRVELRESATRRTADGDEIQWAYFVDGERRLFVAIGSGSLLDHHPKLLAKLSVAEGGYVWPQQLGATTLAATNGGRTLIVRSESIDTAGEVRTMSELRTVSVTMLANLD